MKKNLIVLQDGYKECGAASLLSIIHYYKGSIPMSRLLEMTHTDKNGTNFYQLKMAGEELGFNVQGYKIEHYQSLLELTPPFIIQLLDQNYEHFVVVYEAKKNKIVVMDPAIGQREISINEAKKIWTGYLLLFRPRKKIENYHKTKYLNKIIIEVFSKNKSMIFTILFLSIFHMIFSCISSFYFQIVADFALNSIKSTFLCITFFFFIFSILKVMSSFFRNQVFVLFSQKLDCTLFLRTFQKILLLPYNYYHNRTTGELISRLNDLIYVKNFINHLILTVCLDGILFIGAGFALFFVNSHLFLFMIIIILIYFCLFQVFRPTLKKYTKINQKNNAHIQSLLVESIGGIETIKNMNIEGTAIKQMEKNYIKALNDQFTYQNISNLELFLNDLLSSLGMLLFIFLGFTMIEKGKISIGHLMSSLVLANYFFEPALNLIQFHKEYFYSSNSIERINHLFEVEEENLCTKTNFVVKGNLQFTNLSFSYNQENNALENINFTIPEGSKVMILGNSGSGKSTILKLLFKYYKINSGMISLNDIDLNYYSTLDIRRGLGMISQNEIIYNDSILNNITLYQDIDDNDWMEICKLTYVDDFVKDLFLGYATKLEENGLNLSGGQRQRILLARLLLQNKNILLIDEGLNAVDVNLERKILKNIFSKFSEKTIIVVSHRIENVDLFDQKLYFQQGRLIEESSNLRLEGNKLC